MKKKISNLRNLFANNKSKIASKAAVGSLFVVCLAYMIACDKPVPPCNDYTNPECPNYDPCYGVVDTYNSKQADEQNAAGNVRSTFQAIQSTGFAPVWNTAFPTNMSAHLDSTGSTEPNIKDTAIVSEKMCKTYLQNMSGNPTFMSEVGPSMYSNISADSTYIVTQEDMMNYYLQNQSCIGY